MASEIVESYRIGAEVYNGHDLCKEKSIQLLETFLLPKGLLPLEDIEEFGYNREAGFIWLIQMNETEHTFRQINKVVSYATEVTAFVEKYCLTTVTGVYAKEDTLWLTIVEVQFAYPMSELLLFKTYTGVYASYPASAFELEDET